MPRVKHSFKYTWPLGTTPVYLHDWVETLPQEQKLEFYESQRRQLSLRHGKIDEGLLEVVNEQYIWKDQTAAKINKPYDEIWRQYFERYLQETQTRFEIIEEIIDGEE